MYVNRINPNFYRTVPVNYQSPMNYQKPMTYPNSTTQGPQEERFIFPFLLGGVTGAALAPAFWRPNGYNNNVPCCGPYPMPYQPYPYYGPYITNYTQNTF